MNGTGGNPVANQAPENSPYDLAIAAIWRRSGYDRGFISDPFAGDDDAARGLLRTRRVLERLGNPGRGLPIVHVAGSKGKGSTCALIDGILRAGGVVCGRFLSPHLHSYRERFVVDGAAIPEPDFATVTNDAVAAAEEVEAADPSGGTVTAWELSTAMALLWFQRRGCDVAVIEVGLGGTLDATNVVDPEVSAITRLDYEHTAILGDTMTEIAANKAGIIKPGRPSVTAAQPEEGLAVIVARAREMGSDLMVAGRDFSVTGTSDSFSCQGPWGRMDDLTLAMVGDHQVENAGLAIAAASTLARTNGSFRDTFDAAVRIGLRTTVLPGRFERVSLDDDVTVVIDGAHTAASMTALARTLEQRYPGMSPFVIVGLLTDKDPGTVLAPLARIAGECVAVAPDSPRALDVDAVWSALRSRGLRAGRAGSTRDALRQARADGHRLIVVTGSLSVAAEARDTLGLVTT